MRTAITLKEMAQAINAEIKKGNGNKKILIGADDEGNEFRPCFFTISPTAGNVSCCTLIGVSEKEALKDYVILG